MCCSTRWLHGRPGGVVGTCRRQLPVRTQSGRDPAPQQQWTAADSGCGDAVASRALLTVAADNGEGTPGDGGPAAAAVMAAIRRDGARGGQEGGTRHQRSRDRGVENQHMLFIGSASADSCARSRFSNGQESKFGSNSRQQSIPLKVCREVMEPADSSSPEFEPLAEIRRAMEWTTGKRDRRTGEDERGQIREERATIIRT
jgi:hypothetical protein